VKILCWGCPHQLKATANKDVKIIVISMPFIFCIVGLYNIPAKRGRGAYIVITISTS